ncbi:Gfo/Idh/MocA family oxidoreductase [Actinopolymorpha sp. B17G11]|uniref:Gfo/Idh/MocA family protein n=1 Tax=Actinopolymorpha sp. B17G11 TaxID=3160861 RepID=UPI0032E5119B
MTAHPGRLRMALLGCGDVAQRDYLPELTRLRDRVNLVAVCGRTEERTRSVAAQYDVPSWYTDYERMLAEIDCDVVVNLTPIQEHYRTTMAALKHGMHVYTEKPIATSSAEALTLLNHAQQAGLVLVSAPSVLLFPQVRIAHQLLAEGAIGPVYSVRGSGFGGVPPWHGFPSDPSQYFIRGGGPAMDMGVYPLHAITGLLGPVRRVVAMTARAQDGFVVPDGPARGTDVPIEVDDNWHLLLNLGTSRLASVSTNNVVQGSHAPQLELCGLQGTIELNLLDVAAPVEVLRPHGEWETIRPPGTGRAAGPDHLLGVEHLIDCITTGREPLPSAEHALHVVEVIEAAARSSTTGHAVDVRSSFVARWDGEKSTDASMWSDDRG